MPQSLSLVIVHITFSTKDRLPCLGKSIRAPLHAYLATVVRNNGCECFRVGGVGDHVHLAIRLSRTTTIAALVEELKTSSSKWLKSQQPELDRFSWQRGYGAFSVGPGDLEAVIAYIDNQEEHHRSRSFQDEYRAFLTKYESNLMSAMCGIDEWNGPLALKWFYCLSHSLGRCPRLVWVAPLVL